MNTKAADPIQPGEEILALWLEGELDGPQLAEVDAWAAARPDLLVQREALVAWKASLRAVIPADQQPPFSDFFNSRIAQALCQPEKPQPIHSLPGHRAWWRNLAVPALAAVMAFCFWLGTEFQTTPVAPVTVVALKEPPAVYTPLKGVTVAVVSAPENDGTVIVLEGLAAMPDSLEVPETSGINSDGSLKLVTKPEAATF